MSSVAMVSVVFLCKWQKISLGLAIILGAAISLVGWLKNLVITLFVFLL